MSAHCRDKPQLMLTQVKGRLLLNVVVRKSTTILELLASENQALLVGWNALLVLDLRLNVIDRIGRLNFKGDSLPGKGLDENLHATTETEDKVKSALLLDIVVRKSATIFELLASEDQTLLVGRDSANRGNQISDEGQTS